MVVDKIISNIGDFENDLHGYQFCITKQSGYTSRERGNIWARRC